MTPAKTTSMMFSGLALLMAPAITAPAYAMTEPGAAVGTMPPASVLVFDQKADGQTITVKYASLPKAGYIAIYGSNESGKPAGEPLGHVALKAGDHRDIKVTLAKAQATKSRLWTSLYEDRDGDAKLDKSKDGSFWEGRPLSWGGAFEIQ